MEVTLIQNFDEKQRQNTKVKITRQYLTKLNSINPDFFTTDLLRKEFNYYELSISDFENLLDEAMFKVDLITKYSINLKAASLELKESFIKAQNNYLNVRKNIAFNLVESRHQRIKIINKKIDAFIYDNYNIELFNNLIIDYFENYKKINKLNDLIKAKDNLLENLSIFIDKDILKVYQANYEKAIQECDIEKLEKLLKQGQQNILNHFKNFITPIDEYQPGQPFYFICHSMSNPNFEGDFFTNYISCSLLTKDLTDTYRNGFGFIFPADNIVGASYQDMYVNNQAIDTDNLSNATTVPCINTPELIIKKALEQKEENKKIRTDQKVYTEVVVSKFNPLAIFCLTNGSKDLNQNYRQALKLQKKFPHLKIIEIDKTLYKENLEEEKISLIHDMEMSLNGTYPDYKLDYSRFDWFFEKFLKLKKQPNYTKEDIIALYLENRKLLSFDLNCQDLFSGKYDIETIKYILLNNYNFNIKKILNGNISYNTLTYLYNNLKNNYDKDFLNNIFKGLGNFMELYPKINIDDEILNEIKKQKIIDFISINQVLINQINNKYQKKQNEFINYQKKYQLLTKEKIKKENRIAEIEKQNNILNLEFLYNIAKIDIEMEQDSLNYNEMEIKNLKEKIEKLREDKEKQELEKKQLKHFKIFNLKKLNQIDLVINDFISQIKCLEIRLDMYKQNSLENKNNILSYRQKWEKDTGFKIEEFDIKLKEAAIFIKENDWFFEKLELDKINNELTNMEKVMENLKQDIDALDEIHEDIKSI